MEIAPAARSALNGGSSPPTQGFGGGAAFTAGTSAGGHAHGGTSQLRVNRAGLGSAQPTTFAARAAAYAIESSAPSASVVVYRAPPRERSRTAGVRRSALPADPSSVYTAAFTVGADFVVPVVASPAQALPFASSPFGYPRTHVAPPLTAASSQECVGGVGAKDDGGGEEAAVTVPDQVSRSLLLLRQRASSKRVGSGAAPSK